ncbi:hypothetical protein HGRIS_009158 [Hohenbuehelia grisea]|uniref:Uncharacterized protein n=1 Tax=Hohenbuehelia grisea TaxID=104357 RepID=A0ABR3J1N8_9AGAR
MQWNYKALLCVLASRDTLVLAHNLGLGVVFGQLRVGFTLDQRAGIHPRQTSTIPLPPTVPAQCRTSCDSSLPIIGSCTPALCCTTTFEVNYFNCIKCIGATLASVDYGPPQRELDSLFAACAAEQLPINKLTLPGQDPNRPIPSVTIGQNPPPPPPTSSSRAQPSGTSSSPAQSSTGQSSTTSVTSSFQASNSGSTILPPSQTTITAGTTAPPAQQTISAPSPSSAPTNSAMSASRHTGWVSFLIAAIVGWNMM